VGLFGATYGRFEEVVAAESAPPLTPPRKNGGGEIAAIFERREGMYIVDMIDATLGPQKRQ
jgi:hypothetical protein